MIDAGGRSRGPCWQPPRLRHKKIGAEEGNQPDYDEQNEAHCARPPKWFPEPSPRSLPKIPKKKRGEFKPGRIYHSFFSAQAASCIYYIFCCCSFSSQNGLNLFWQRRKHALTKFFVLSNIRFVSGGSSEMLRTSRCFRITLFQSVGPRTLSAIAPCLCSISSLSENTSTFWGLSYPLAARKLKSFLRPFAFPDQFIFDSARFASARLIT